MNSLFAAFKPSLQAAGVTPRENWDATKRQIHGVARAQVRNPHLKPETRQKWQVLGRLTQLDPPAIVYKRAD